MKELFFNTNLRRQNTPILFAFNVCILVYVSIYMRIHNKCFYTIFIIRSYNCIITSYYIISVLKITILVNLLKY